MANQVIAIILGVAYIILCICCLIECRRRRKNETKSIFLPQIMLWIGLICSGMFLVCACFAMKYEENIGVVLCFGFFVLLGMSLMLGWKNCFIMYDNVGFTQKTLWGKERYFTYDQVTALQKERRNPIDDVILFVNEKKVTFSSRTENADYFMMILQSRYRQIHGKKTIPELPKHIQERGGFRAHVYNPGQYLVILIMFIVMIVGVGAWIVVDNLQPVSENDCEMYTVSFSAWEIDDAELILTTPQMKEKFEIRGYREYLSGYDQLIAKCDGQVYFTVWATRINPKGAPAYFCIEAISSGEEVYRTFEDSMEYNKSTIPMFIGIFGGLLILVLVMAVLTYIVGCNPKKFPRWVVHLFFKEGAVDI